uniref:DUF1772 domain-containing protein n=1 Tax=Pelagomonas calceolata TaxID=35677 RepID=A0A7S3ZSQ7_9STRA|mmetsp:Transcript_20111/g.57082  ORF Transcript_20111/g.57082 Transcript_20111/m.57082 type:complete len:239 (-) Transcript_20111:35-751(-)
MRCSFIALAALITSVNGLSATRRRLPVSREEPATRAIKKNLARAFAVPLVAGAASRVEPVRKLMAGFDRIRVGLVAGTVGAAILGGCYFIFSFCVMDALNQQDPQTAINTMNSINVVIVNPKFIAAFMGTPLICCWLVAEALAVGVGSSTDVALMFGGALTLIVGEFLETIICHIPKNDALAAHKKGGNDAEVWARYYTSWTAWNHVRMVASLATVVQFSLALFYRGARLGGGYGGLP